MLEINISLEDQDNSQENNLKDSSPEDNLKDSSLEEPKKEEEIKVVYE